MISGKQSRLLFYTINYKTIDNYILKRDFVKNNAIRIMTLVHHNRFIIPSQADVSFNQHSHRIFLYLIRFLYVQNHDE